MEYLIKNAEEFIETGEDSFKKERWNAAVANFFRAIVNLCDFIIYRQIKIIPKNHTERFELLEKYFSAIYKDVSELFNKYRDSYNLRLSKSDAEIIKKYLYELKDSLETEKRT